jgi:peptidoglycan/LPS O-acetylase OafA/YrhL
VFVVALAYALMRWYDRPMRAWLSKRFLPRPGMSTEPFSAPSPAVAFASDQPVLQPISVSDR